MRKPGSEHAATEHGTARVLGCLHVRSSRALGDFSVRHLRDGVPGAGLAYGYARLPLGSACMVRHEPLRNAAWHYFPQFVFFFMPFYALPQPWCDIAWRIFSAALFVGGLWRLLRLLPVESSRVTRLFFYLTVIALSQTLDALHNGQANLVFAGLCAHA